MTRGFDNVLKEAFVEGWCQGRDAVGYVGETDREEGEARFQQWRREFGNVPNGLEDEKTVGVGAASSVGSEQAEDAAGQVSDARSTPDPKCRACQISAPNPCHNHAGIIPVPCSHCGSTFHLSAYHEQAISKGK